MTSPACPFVWYELMTGDAAATAEFYRRVIGWQTVDAGMPGAPYTLLSVEGQPVAGLMAIDDAARAGGARPGWIGYVGVADVDAQLAGLVEAGGKVHRPAADIPGVGRFAVVGDPQGAVFCLFSGLSAAPPAVPAPGTPGTVGWHELCAVDQAAALTFYSAQFGWRAGEAFDMGPAGRYQLFRTGGGDVGGIMTRPSPDMPPFWLFYFNVPALDATLARVTDGGGQVPGAPMAVPGGAWVAQCLDPQGAAFALVAPKR